MNTIIQYEGDTAEGHLMLSPNELSSVVEATRAVNKFRDSHPLAGDLVIRVPSCSANEFISLTRSAVGRAITFM